MKKMRITLVLGIITVGTILPSFRVLGEDTSQTNRESTPISDSSKLFNEDQNNLNIHQAFEKKSVVIDTKNPAVIEQKPLLDEQYLIPDLELRTYINSNLGKPADYSATKEELASMKSIVARSDDYRNKQIKSWEGLQYLTDLKTIDFTYITTDANSLFTALKKLPKLEILDLNTVYFSGSDTTVTDWNGDKVGISQLIDYSPLADIPTLKILNSTYVNVDRSIGVTARRSKFILSKLGEHKQFTQINLASIGATDDDSFSWIKNLTNLVEFQAVDSSLNSVEAFKNLPNLQDININGSDVRDFSPIVDKSFFTGANNVHYKLEDPNMYTTAENGSRLVNLNGIVKVGSTGFQSATIQKYTSIDNFSIVSSNGNDGSLNAVFKMGDLVNVNAYNYKTGANDKYNPALKGTAFPYSVTTKNGKKINGLVYLDVKDQLAPEVKTVDSTLKVGSKWDAKDNFVSAVDGNGIQMSEFDLTKLNVSGSVDTNKPGVYKVTYSNGVASSTATITVIDNPEIKVKDSEIFVGQKWSPADNFVSAIGNDGQSISELDDTKIQVDGAVDTDKAGTYKVTYKLIPVNKVAGNKALLAKYNGISAVATITVKPKKSTVSPVNPDKTVTHTVTKKLPRTGEKKSSIMGYIGTMLLSFVLIIGSTKIVKKLRQ